MNHNDLNQCRLDVERLRKASDRLVELKNERDLAVSHLRFTLREMQRIADWLKPNQVGIENEGIRARALDTLRMMRGWMK